MSTDNKLVDLEDRNINRRLLELRKTLGMSRKAFGECAGMSDSVIKNIEYGLTSPRMFLINMVCEKYSVRDEWVLEGTGEMFRDPAGDENAENGTSERIKNVRKTLGLTQEEFAAKIKVSRPNIGNIETGKIGITERIISDICETFKVNRTWLETGEGEQFVPEQTEDKIIEAFGRVVKMPDDAFVKQFVAALAELSPDDWKRVEEFARRVVEGGLKNEKDD